MQNYRSDLCIFFSDEFIGYYLHGDHSKHMHFGEIKMTKGVIHNGYIMEPDIILEKLKSAFKQSKVRPRHIRMVIHEQNIIIREITIEKKMLEKTVLDEYVHAQIGKSIQTPFKKPTLTYHVKEETGLIYKLILFVVDENLLYDYLDLFRSLKVKEVTFELPSSALYKMVRFAKMKSLTPLKNTADKISHHLNEQKIPNDENLMIVSLYNQGLSLRIIDQHLPVFGMIEEYEGSLTYFYEMIDNYVERIQNYYAYNLNKGKKQIDRIHIFNFTDRIDNDVLKEKIESHNQTPIDFFVIDKLDAYLSKLPKSCYMAYGASIIPNASCPQLINVDFKLKFNQKITQYMHYAMTVSFAIFSSVSLIYIPYATMAEDINVKQGINSSLKNQLEVLQSEIQVITPPTQLQKNYSIAYDFLNQVDASQAEYIADLHALLKDDLKLVSYQINSKDKKITFIIQSQDALLARNYVVDIFEQYGITTLSQSNRWIVSRPETRDVASTFLEVTVYYA